MQSPGVSQTYLLRARVALLVLLGAMGAALAFPMGSQGRPTAVRKPLTRPQPLVWGLEVYSVNLPDEEPVVPHAPNYQQFTALCRLCHSPRLVLTQPRFSEKKWTDIVHKMVVVYGAPMSPQQEQAIVDYLIEVRGLEH